MGGPNPRGPATGSEIPTCDRLDDVRIRLSSKLIDVFDVPSGSLSVLIFTSVVLALALSAVTVSAQLKAEHRRAALASLHQKARRLRWDKDDSAVVPPELPAAQAYHLFLSQ